MRAWKLWRVAKISLRPALWWLGCNLLAVAISAQCSNPTPVPNGTWTTGDHSQLDNNALSLSNFVIGGSATATFVAGNCIQLLPGFHATAGTAATTFHAWVDIAPSAISFSPSNQTGLSQPFTWTVSSPSGYSNLAHVFALFNTTAGSTVNTCYIHYDPASNLVYLADDASANWLGGFVPGSSGSASNSQCSIYGTGASISTSGTQLTLTVPVTFQTSFSGSKNEYLFALDNAGVYTEWQQMGTRTVPQPDFTMSATPSATTTPGGSATYTVSVAPVQGFSGVVTLSATNLPAGVTAQFTPPTLTGSGTSTMTLITASGTQAVTSTVTVAGVSGSLYHSASTSLAVQDFSVGVNPGSASTLPGGTASYLVSVTPINGFAGTVNFQVPSLPVGATATFSPPTLAGGGTTSLNIATTTGTPVATSSITVNAYSGSLQRPAAASLVVQDFGLSVSPSSQRVVSGAATSYAITLSPLDGFTGPVTFSVSGQPSGSAVNFSPSTLTGSGTTTLTVSTGVSTLAGSYGLTITASSFGRTQTTTATLVVPITVTISPPQPSQNLALSSAVQLSATVTGTTNTGVCWQLLPMAAWPYYQAEGQLLPYGDCSGVITYQSNISIYQNPYVRIKATSVADSTVSQEWDAVLANCYYCVTITRDPNYPNDPQGALLPGQSVHLVASVTHGGTVTSWVGPPGTLSTGSSLTTIYTAPQDTSGSPAVTILASSQDSWGSIALARVAGGSPPPPPSDFTITASPSTNTVSPGGTAQYTIKTTGSGGVVSFNVSGLPNGASASFNPMTAPVGGATIMTIHASTSSSVGSYTLTITGSSGSHVHSTTAALNVQTGQQDFFLSVSPASQSVGDTNSTSYVVRVNPINGFTGAVTMAVAGLPPGAAVRFSPAAVAGSGASVLSVGLSPCSPTGTFSFGVTGTSGPLVHSASATLEVSSPTGCNSASMISPAAGTTLIGGPATFTWTSEAGVAQYQLLLGSTIGGSDYASGYYSPGPGGTQAATINLPSVSQRQALYATLRSSVLGVWQSRAYVYGLSSTLPPSNEASQAKMLRYPDDYYVFNDNIESKPLPYCLNDSTGTYGNYSADGMKNCRITAGGDGVTAVLAAVAAQSLNGAMNEYDVKFIAAHTAAPGWRELTCASRA
jgi:hypothetical protein